LEDIDYRHSRGLSKQVMLELSSTRWIDAHRTVLVTGPSGIGKSYLACALGNFAARTGYTVLYLRAPRLSETMQQTRGDGSHLKTLTRLSHRLGTPGPTGDRGRPLPIGSHRHYQPVPYR
jgi:DNA replication protein DnaC